MKNLTLSFFIIITILTTSAPGDNNTNSESTLMTSQQHQSTDWHLQPSFKYDVLCFLNSLTGDPFYLKYYQKEYNKFEPKLTPEARKAVGKLRKWKKKNNQIISAFLTNYLSVIEGETLDDLLTTLEDSKALKHNLKASFIYSYWKWHQYKSIRDELETIFLWLKDIEFESYWEENIKPQILQRIAEITPELPQYNVIPEIEQLLGHPLASNQITVYVLYYTQPHGIKITGTRFITDVSYSIKVVVRNAAHEMMHPPYYVGDKELLSALKQLKKDAFLMDKVVNHNPSFGYNSFDGYIEENVVRALDQIIGERLGIAEDARKRWKMEDDGMHVFAAVLYHIMKEEHYNQNNLQLRDFLINAFNTGKLRPGKIENIYNAFYSEKD